MLSCKIKVELFANKKPSERYWYAYDVLLDGEAIVSNSRDPEHDLARVLATRGITGAVEIIDGRTGKPRSRVSVEAAAERGIGSNLDHYTWKPSEIGKDSSLTVETVPLGVPLGKAA